MFIDVFAVTTQRFCKEFVTWRGLRHPNVLPLLGVIMSGTQFVMVSEWMPNGNINQFVKAHQDKNRFKLVRLSRTFLPSPLVNEDAVSVAGRRCKGIGIYA